MTEDERASQLSAMFDGELPPAECELLARRLSRDEALRRQWGSYALIGAAMRGEPIAARGSVHVDIAARVRQTLAQPQDAESVVTDADAAREAGRSVGTGGRRPRMPRWAVPVSGFGLAAGVAAAALLWLRIDTPTAAAVANVVPAVRPAAAAELVVPMPLPTAPPVASGAALGSSDPAEDGYTVPPPAQGSVALAGGATLANFLVAHSEVSMPMLRRNALSTLVAVPIEAEPAAVATSVPRSTRPVPVTTDPVTGGALERP